MALTSKTLLLLFLLTVNSALSYCVFKLFVFFFSLQNGTSKLALFSRTFLI